MRLLGSRQTKKVTDWMFWRWMDIIPRGQDRYLVRLYLINCPWFGLKLHWFEGPDPDQDCHDHPWWFLSWVLRGGYTEKRQEVVHPYEGCLRTEAKPMWVRSQWLEVRRRWSWCFRSPTDVHSIIKIEPNTMTFIINGPRVRSWGFWVPVKWSDKVRFVPWKKYLGLEESTPEV